MKKMYAGISVVVFSAGVFLPACSDINEHEKIERPRFHTRDNEGVWVNKSDTHLARVNFIKKDTIEVTVPLKPTRQPLHYIEVIMLMDGEKQIDNKTFPFTLEEAHATFKLPKPEKGTYRVLAKCNLHDVWMTPVVARKDVKKIDNKKKQ